MFGRMENLTWLDLSNFNTSNVKDMQGMFFENKKLKNYKEKLISQQNMCFSSSSIPSIELKKYLERIIIYTESEESTIIIALIYIDRLSKFSGIILTPYNIHRIMRIIWIEILNL